MFSINRKLKHGHIIQKIDNQLVENFHETRFRVNNKLGIPLNSKSRYQNVFILGAIKLQTLNLVDIKHSANLVRFKKT